MLPPDFIDLPAVMSGCGAYRYFLRRRLGDSGRPVCFIMHNPSTADDRINDPTITRCMGFARAWGGSDLLVVNRFAYRSPSPDALWKTGVDPVGAANDEAILAVVEYCHAQGGLAVAAWGEHGKTAAQRQSITMRTQAVRAILDRQGLPLFALALTRRGTPRHPLYLKAELKPIRWIEERSGPALEA